MLKEVTPKHRQIKIHLRSLSDRCHPVDGGERGCEHNWHFLSCQGQPSFSDQNLHLFLSFPTFLPSQGEAVAAPVHLNFHLFECISAAGAFEASSPQVQAWWGSSLPSPVCLSPYVQLTQGWLQAQQSNQLLGGL